jgi:cytoskeletal protein CcmA (bactofilin family)
MATERGPMGGILRFLGLSGAPDEAGPRTGLSTGVGDASDPGRAVLGSGLSLRGEITGEGDFHVYGRFEGEIDVSGRVVVAESSEVDANVNAASIVIAGKVRGNLSATTRLDILPTGVLTGTLKAGSFSAAEGASVKGEIWLERGQHSRTGETRGLGSSEARE